MIFLALVYMLVFAFFGNMAGYYYRRNNNRDFVACTVSGLIFLVMFGVTYAHALFV